jgi:hypothetical protein
VRLVVILQPLAVLLRLQKVLLWKVLRSHRAAASRRLMARRLLCCASPLYTEGWIRIRQKSGRVACSIASLLLSVESVSVLYFGVLTFLPLMEDGWAWMIDTWLLSICVHLPTAFVYTLLGHASLLNVL